MFRGTLLHSSPNHGAWLTPRVRRLALLAGLAAFAAGGAAIPHLPSFRSPWSWFEGGVADAFVAVFYSFMVAMVVADSRRVGFQPRQWLAAVLVFNVAGLVFYLIASARRTGDWKRIALPLAYIFEALLLGICATMPLISTAALPPIAWLTPVPPPPAGMAARTKAKGPRPVPRPLSDRVLRAPRVIPPLISEAETPPEAPQPFGSGEYRPGAPNGVPGSDFTNWLGETPVIPNSQTAARPTIPQKPMVVSSGVESAKLIFGPAPEYPVLARMTRTEGTVRLKAIIGRDGAIEELRVLGGHPLLVKAAVEAVERWRYSPTLLDNKPVKVETEIEVNFTLSD
jgi:periplasmic protein TonB